MTSHCCENVSSGALLELGAVGVEERYTVCNPQKSFFVQCCERHTNFAYAHLDFKTVPHVSGLATWNDNYVLEATMPKHGDLLIGTFARFYLGRLTFPADTIVPADTSAEFHDEGDERLHLHWCEEVGHAIVKRAEWIVGTTTVDGLEDLSLHAYHQHGVEEGRQLHRAIGSMRGGPLNFNNYTNTDLLRAFSATDNLLYVPLPFTYMQDTSRDGCCSGARNAFPLVALQHDQIKYRLTLRGRKNLIVANDITLGFGNYVSVVDDVTGGALLEAGISQELIFLDFPEQKSWASQSFHKYFEFTQCTKVVSVAEATKSMSIDLPFNHSLTKLTVMYRANFRTDQLSLEYFNFGTPLPYTLQPGNHDGGAFISDGGIPIDLNPFDCLELLYSNTERVSRPGIYWHEIVPYLRHKRIADSFVCVYSFALSPEDGTCPTGASNIGQMPTARLNVTFINNKDQGLVGDDGDLPVLSGINDAGQLFIYAKTQNFYKIAGGRLGVLWSAV